MGCLSLDFFLVTGDAVVTLVGVIRDIGPPLVDVGVGDGHFCCCPIIYQSNVEEGSTKSNSLWADSPLLSLSPDQQTDIAGLTGVDWGLGELAGVAEKAKVEAEVDGQGIMMHRL